MRFRLIEDDRDIWPVRVMCKALSVSPSGYYTRRSRSDSPRKIVILDLFTRKAVGWAMREHMRAELTIAALTMAIQRQRPGAGLIHHSDRGSQPGLNWSSQHVEGEFAMTGRRRRSDRSGRDRARRYACPAWATGIVENSDDTRRSK